MVLRLALFAQDDLRAACSGPNRRDARWRLTALFLRRGGGFIDTELHHLCIGVRKRLASALKIVRDQC